MGVEDSDVLAKNQVVDTVMRRWPGTIRVFLDYRMHCIGCPVGHLHTVEEACSEHGIELGALLDDLREAARHNQVGCSGPDDSGVPSASKNSL